MNNNKLYNIILDAHEYLQNLDEEDEQEKLQTRCWYIPISYSTKAEPNSKGIKVRQWLTCNGPQELIIDNLHDDDWILFDSKVNGRCSLSP